MNIIFTAKGVKIAVYTRKHPETLYILLNNRNFSSLTTNDPGSFFPCIVSVLRTFGENIFEVTKIRINITWESELLRFR